MTLASWQTRRALEFVEANLETRFSVAEVARCAHVSCSHFCREFKRAFGMGVHAYVMRRRIELAQHLMLTTDAPLSEIALRVGLTDQSHFTRWHRRVVGVTPGAWRRSCKSLPQHLRSRGQDHDEAAHGSVRLWGIGRI